MRHLILLLATIWIASGQTRLLRHPAYHNGKVAFSYLGDIWVANEDGTGAARMTDHRARDVFPRFSPDGKWIAFSSARYGNYDVFVMPAQGGTPKQLTYQSGPDMVVGWSRDSKRIMFEAARGRVFPGRVSNLYEVPVDGGLEQLVPTDWGAWGSYSPDGSKLAYNRHNSPWWRQHYRGSNAYDLWLFDTNAKTFRKLIDDEYKGNSAWPQYGRNGEIYFVADRLSDEKSIKFGGPEVMKSINNIWKVSERGGKPVQVTHHTSGSLFYPSISTDGRVLVYEENAGLWKLDTASGKSVEIKLTIATDSKDNSFELRTLQGEADSFDLSPSTRRAAISTHGEIFTIATDRGEPRRVTTTYWRETEPQWSPEGKWIAFVSDRTGRDEIWISNERGESAKKLTDSDTEKLSIEWAPDSKSLAYSASDHKLYRVEVESGQSRVIASSTVWNIQDPRFAPDGRWISYGKREADSRVRIYINSAEGGQERAVGRDVLFSSSGARWTPDGKKLLLLGGVQQSGVGATARTSLLQLYSVTLGREDKNPRDRGIDSEEEAQQATPTGPRGRDAAAAKVEVNIDWDGLDRRIRQVTRSSDTVRDVVVSPDSRTYAYIAGRSLYTVQEESQRTTRLTDARPEEDSDAPPAARVLGGGISNPQFSKDGRTVYFQEGTGLYSVGVADQPAGVATSRVPERRRVQFTARVEIDHDAERRQIFNESWRIMKNRFYDPKMHGADWARMKERYEPLLAFVSDQEELHNVILQMIGELNASHTGMTSGPGDRNAIQTRYPGFELEPDSSGYYRVSHIYRKGPADHDYVRIGPGNFILSVNDAHVKAPDNYWKLYNLAPGRKLEFTVNVKPVLEGAWKTTVEPVTGTAFATLQYEKWVDERSAMVAKQTGGEFGYLHIRAMDGPSLEKFQRDLVENRSKKALILDQRFNGGGGIDQELLQILGQRREYQMTRSRDSIEVVRPQRAFFGPMVVMQNERSASNAEMFPDGFRALGLGKVIGVPTYGGVIGTGAYRLMDGSTIRTPGSGVYTASGINMENYGVPPDVYVDNRPEDFLAGRDVQIEKAIEVLRVELKK